MKLILFEEKYRDELELLLIGFSKEIYGVGACDVDSFINNHWCIYLAIRDDKVIGFSSFTINDYYGLRTSTIGNDYIYIIPKYRNGKTMYMFSLQAGRISIEHKLPLEHYYASEDAFKISRKLSGKKIYEAYVYEVCDVENTFNKLKEKVNIK